MNYINRQTMNCAARILIKFGISCAQPIHSRSAALDNAPGSGGELVLAPNRSLCVDEPDDLGTERHSRTRDVLAVGRLMLAQEAGQARQPGVPRPGTGGGWDA